MQHSCSTSWTCNTKEICLNDYQYSHFALPKRNTVRLLKVLRLHDLVPGRSQRLLGEQLLGRILVLLLQTDDVEL